ncbi:MAG: Ribosomal RNA small subunit methyltransferase D [Chlamydiae bacterium]|nr:Ribosomal RNA small subunit methyltransferase D [Chlamydiota bacterium]
MSRNLFILLSCKNLFLIREQKLGILCGMQIIAGKYKNKRICTPKGLETRPTSGRLREAVFNICQHCIEGVDFLDLFSGSGVMGLEALSRGAKSATFIDKSRRSIQSIQRNVEALGVQDLVRVLQGDVFQWIEKLVKEGRHFDLIYVDPPYGMVSSREGRKMTCSSMVLDFVDKGDLLKEGGMVFIEESSDAKPEVESLEILTLTSSRNVGRSLLLQYQKR